LALRYYIIGAKDYLPSPGFQIPDHGKNNLKINKIKFGGMEY
jgi:hypothetical protein